MEGRCQSVVHLAFNTQPMRADVEGCIAARMTQIFPDWLVMWRVSSAEFWAYPYFAEPAGAVLHDADPNVLADEMRRLQSTVVHELRNDSIFDGQGMS